MNGTVPETVLAKTKELIAASTCCAAAQKAAEDWLAALGTEKEAAAARAYVEELERDIMPLENLIAFAKSPDGARVFGGRAGEVAAHAGELLAAGKKYCDCPACAAAEAILAEKAAILR